jgi:hypothetical protein
MGEEAAPTIQNPGDAEWRAPLMRGRVDEMKPGNFKSVNHKIPLSHIHDKPPVSRGAR